MYKYSIPQADNPILFETILEPLISEIDELHKGTDKNEGDLNVLFGIKNRVAVGEPYSENLMTMIFEGSQEIPEDIMKMINEYDFHSISLSCSFEPDNRCKLTWVRFGVALKAVSRETGEELTEKPIAYDMFPDEITTEIKCKNNISINPKLKFDAGKIKAEADGVKFSTQKEIVIYEPEIYAFGLRTSKIAWNFKATTEKGIWGNKRNLLVIVKTPKDSKIKGKFLLSGEVKTQNILRVPLKTRKDNIVEVEYDLSQ